MLVDAKRRRARDVLDHDLEPVVAERLDLPAVAADEVVVVIAGGRRRLVLGAPATELELVHESQLGERVESAIDARNPDLRSPSPDLIVDLGRGETAVLRLQYFDHRGPCSARLEARLAKSSLSMVAPDHAANDSRSHFLLGSPALTRIILVLILALASLTACGGDSGSSDDEKTDVVAAFYPLAWAAEQVGGNEVAVRNLTPPGTEPHDIELSPRDVERIRAADVVLYLGAGFQPAVEDAIEGADGTVVDVLEGQRLVAGEAHEEEGHAAEEEEEGHAEESELDPHVWLDPVRFSSIAERVGEALGDPSAAEDLTTRLEELDTEFEQGLADCPQRHVVTSHAAFGYLTRRYGLEQVPITGLSPEAEPTPRELEEVVEHVRETKATTIYFETLISPRLAETVARETGAKTDVLDPLEGLSEDDLDGGADYLSVMRENLASLRRGLECR